VKVGWLVGWLVGVERVAVSSVSQTCISDLLVYVASPLFGGVGSDSSRSWRQQLGRLFLPVRATRTLSLCLFG
jgi:hypothetical protein